MIPSSHDYRPDIDGLRAVAILLVVVFHADPALLPSGFVGVDVFFVISGYLITDILRSDLEQGQFSLLSFYARRIRRLLPALLVVLLSVWLYARSALAIDDFFALGKHLGSAALFVSNFVLWGEAGYFDRETHAKPLMHLWSLAVEEQFYIVWPLLLAFAFRVGKARGALVAAVALGGTSLGLTLALADHASFVFFSFPTRAWELALGCALALVPFHARAPSSTARAHACSLAGVGLIAAGGVLIRGGPSPTGAWLLLLPTVGAALLLYAGPAAILNRALGLPLLVQIGLISYPLYLWHWPILSLSFLETGSEPTLGAAHSELALAVALAVVTRFAIELPARRRLVIPPVRSASAWRIVAVGVTSLSLVALVGWGTFRGHLLTPRQELGRRLAGYAARPLPDYVEGRCFLGDPAQTYRAFVPECSPAHEGSGLRVGVWGDSYAARLFHAFAPEVLKAGGSFTALAASRCAPVLGVQVPRRPNCAAINEYAFKRISDNHLSTVVLSANWLFSYFKAVPGATLGSIDATIARLRQAGVRNVVVLGQPPFWPKSLSELLIRQALMPGLPIPEDVAPWLRPGVFEVDAVLRQHLGKSDAHYVPLLDVACPEQRCNPFIDGDSTGELWTFDDGHPTPEAARRFVQRAWPSILATR